jgi:hypothetical protein
LLRPQSENGTLSKNLRKEKDRRSGPVFDKSNTRDASQSAAAASLGLASGLASDFALSALLSGFDLA